MSLRQTTSGCYVAVLCYKMARELRTHQRAFTKERETMTFPLGLQIAFWHFLPLKKKTFPVAQNGGLNA